MSCSVLVTRRSANYVTDHSACEAQCIAARRAGRMGHAAALFCAGLRIRPRYRLSGIACVIGYRVVSFAIIPESCLGVHRTVYCSAE